MHEIIITQIQETSIFIASAVGTMFNFDVLGASISPIMLNITGNYASDNLDLSNYSLLLDSNLTNNFYMNESYQNLTRLLNILQEMVSHLLTLLYI